MKKSILLGIACLIMTCTMVNGFATPSSMAKAGSASVYKRLKNKNSNKTESLRLFQVTRIKGSTNKYLLHIAKMPDTKIKVQILDAKGRTLYFNSFKTKRDLAKVVVIKDEQPVTFRISDDAGFVKTFAYNN